MSDPNMPRIGAPDPVSVTPSTAILIARLVTGVVLLLGSVGLRLTHDGGSVMLIALFVLGLILVLCSFAPEGNR